MEEKRDSILKDEAVKRLLDRMRAACAVRECCEKDIREKMAKALRSGEGESGERADETAGRSGEENVTEAPRWKSDEIIGAVVWKLKEEGFLSDRRFAAAFARDKAHLLGWGPRKIRHALQAKRIDGVTVDEALALIDESAAERQLERMLGRKLTSLRSSGKTLTDEEVKVKLLRFATGRGYGYDAIVSAIGRLEKVGWENPDYEC